MKLVLVVGALLALLITVSAGFGVLTGLLLLSGGAVMAPLFRLAEKGGAR